MAACFLAVAGMGCSKTQDTAPENRIFGNPPTIEGVTATSGFNAATCDISEIIQGFFCTQGVHPSSYSFSPGPGVTLSGTYSQLRFEVVVTDPQNTPSASDLLLVTASYLSNDEGQLEENSLVLLDDGSSNQFDFSSQGTIGGDCEPNDDAFRCGPGGIACALATYDLRSNDATSGDGRFTRTFAFTVEGDPSVPAGNALSLLSNCVARANGEAPVSATKLIGAPLEFKFEAVDKSGNLTTWPLRPQLSLAFSTFSCTGDDCACCFLTSTDPGTDCRQKSGMVDSFGVGLCTTF